MTLKVLFIYPDVWAYGGDFYYGIAYMSAVLKSSGHQASLLHVTREISKKKFVHEVKRIGPDLVGFTSTSNQFPYVKLFATWIKGTFDLPVVCGGIHSTLRPDEVISCDEIDIACVGEGEYPLLELANAMESGNMLDKIHNLWIKKGGTIIRNPLRQLISDLDVLPLADREIFQYEKILNRKGGAADFIAGRGCPYGCTYCCNHALRKIYEGHGPYVRIRSVRNVIDEIKNVKDKFGSLIKAINFDDDTFTLFHKWVREFCEVYGREFDLPFACNARADTVNREILTLLKKAGCDTIRIGIESGSEWLRLGALKRQMTNEQIISACKAVHEVGLKLHVFNMIGLPYETPSMIEETIKLNRLVAPNRVQTSVFYPYPKTELYEICERNGFLTDKHKKSYFDEGTTLHLSTLTQGQINEYYTTFRELSAESFIETYHAELWPFYKALKLISRSGTTSLLWWLKSVKQKLYPSYKDVF